MKSPDELTEAFRRQGLKVTPQRQCIFRALHDNPEHPSAESVYELVRAEMPTISLRTVYQTLNDLAAMGELRQLDLGTGSARFDPNLDAHHHLVCDRCGKVHRRVRRHLRARVGARRATPGLHRDRHPGRVPGHVRRLRRRPIPPHPQHPSPHQPT